MICDLHSGKQKTHVCLKSNCGLQLICADCAQQIHFKHITLEINEFQRVIQNMIQRYDKQETLENISLNKLQASQYQLSQLFQQIQQVKRKTFNSQLFSMVNSLLKKLQKENPSKEELKLLQKVGSQFIFYRDQKDEWKYSLVNENKKIEFIEELIDQIKQFSIQIQEKINILTKNISGLNKLIQSQEEALEDILIFRKTDATPRGRRGRPPKAPNSKSPDRYKLKIINFQKQAQVPIQAPIVPIVQQTEEPINVQTQQQTNQAQTEEPVTQRQPSPIIKQSLIELYNNLEDASTKSDSPPPSQINQQYQNQQQQQQQQQQIEMRIQPMRVQIIKRKYQKKAYSRFKFNTDLCLNIHEQIFG